MVTRLSTADASKEQKDSNPNQTKTIKSTLSNLTSFVFDRAFPLASVY